MYAFRFIMQLTFDVLPAMSFGCCCSCSCCRRSARMSNEYCMLFSFLSLSLSLSLYLTATSTSNGKRTHWQLRHYGQYCKAAALEGGRRGGTGAGAAGGGAGGGAGGSQIYCLENRRSFGVVNFF